MIASTGSLDDWSIQARFGCSGVPVMETVHYHTCVYSASICLQTFAMHQLSQLHDSMPFSPSGLWNCSEQPGRVSVLADARGPSRSGQALAAC